MKKKVEYQRSEYEKRIFMNKNRNNKVFFNYIDNKTNSKDGVAQLIVNNEIIATDEGKAHTLSEQYKSVFIEDNGILPPVNRIMPPDLLSDFTISDRDIINSIQNMNFNCAPGVDGIHPKIIKNVYPYLIQPIKRLFQTSIIHLVCPLTGK